MIKTDRFLETSEPDVFAAGNMIEYDSPVFEKRTVNGSWDHSEEMGENAGKNMIGEKQSLIMSTPTESPFQIPVFSNR